MLQNGIEVEFETHSRVAALHMLRLHLGEFHMLATSLLSTPHLYIHQYRTLSPLNEISAWEYWT